MAQLTIRQFLGRWPSEDFDVLGQFDHMVQFGQHVDSVLASVPRPKYPWEIAGGWEGWFQVEFASYLSFHDIDYERENQMERGEEKTTPDFLFSNDNYLAPIEIKCCYPDSKILEQALSDVEKLRGCSSWLAIAVAPQGMLTSGDTSFSHVHTLAGTTMEICCCGK